MNSIRLGASAHTIRIATKGIWLTGDLAVPAGLGALEEVATLASAWFQKILRRRSP